jgi:hypothetical protein
MAIESSVKIVFEPEVLDRTKAGEVNMKMEFSAPDAEKEYWCECDVQVKAPMSLSHDAFLEKGRTRVGILGPNKGKISKQVKLFSSPSMSANDYLITVTTYLYDEEGTIAERRDTSEVIKCSVQDLTTNPQ